MRTTKRLLIMVVAVAMPLAMMTTAMGAPPESICDKLPDHPSCQDPTTTTTVPTIWTCQERVDIRGALWIPGSWSEEDGFCTVSGVPSCIDLRSGHTNYRQWEVTWNGELVRGTVKGLKLVFETGLHGTIHVETVVYAESGTWTTDFIDPDDETFVFVAMAHSGNRWEWLDITVTPLPPIPVP